MKKFLMIALLALAPAANASILLYNDQTTFLAALTGTSFTQAFTAVPSGVVGSPQSFSGNGYGFNVSSTSGLFGVNISGDQSISVNDYLTPLVLTTFVGSPTAVGGYFYFDDGSSALATGIEGTMTASNGVDANLVVSVTAPTSLTSFYGFVSTNGALTSVSFARTTPTGLSGWQNVDDVIVGTASTVPEPASATLLGLGLAAAFCLKWRNSRG